MTLHPLSRSAILISVLIGAALMVGYFAVHMLARTSAPLDEEAAARQAPAGMSLRPSLDCAFHDFMRRGAVVSFYFDVVVKKDELPLFFERAVVAADGTRTNFAGDDRPRWIYALNDDGKPTLTSSDGATHIVLYGLKLGVSGVLLIEAGIRSNTYRNLSGICRQTNLVACGPYPCANVPRLTDGSHVQENQSNRADGAQ